MELLTWALQLCEDFLWKLFFSHRSDNVLYKFVMKYFNPHTQGLSSLFAFCLNNFAVWKSESIYIYRFDIEDCVSCFNFIVSLTYHIFSYDENTSHFDLIFLIEMFFYFCSHEISYEICYAKKLNWINAFLFQYLCYNCRKCWFDSQKIQ